MKKYLLNYYSIMILTLFIVYNLVLNGLKIGDLLYEVFMIIMIIVNTIIQVKFRKDIKCKSLVAFLYMFLCPLSKNILQCIFGISSMLISILTGFMEQKMLIVLAITLIVFLKPLVLLYLIVFVTGFDKDGIYNDKHYYCNNNYEVYAYSAGAADKFHYSIDKRYELLDVDDIIHITYNKKTEVSQGKYEDYIKSHKCNLVGDGNGSK